MMGRSETKKERSEREWNEYLAQAERRTAAFDRVVAREPYAIVAPCDGGTVLIHPSTVKQGWWQSTFFGEDMVPYSDVESPTWQRLLRQIRYEVDWEHAKKATARPNAAGDLCALLQAPERSVALPTKLPRDLKSRKQSGKFDFKPEGLWYSFGDGWTQFLAMDWRKRFNKLRYAYALEVDLSGMVVLENDDDVVAFSDDYAVNISSSNKDPFYLIDWSIVAARFTGIEARVHPRLNLPRQCFWFTSWSIASGCVWDNDAIVRLDLIAKFKKKELERCYGVSGWG